MAFDLFRVAIATLVDLYRLLQQWQGISTPLRGRVTVCGGRACKGVASGDGIRNGCWGVEHISDVICCFYVKEVSTGPWKQELSLQT